MFPAVDESHSELGAATMIALIAMQELRRNPPRLADGGDLNDINRRRKVQGIYTRSVWIWSSFLKHPLDIIVPIILSIICVAIFVAETTGIVLSANIIGNSVALSDSPRCFAPNRTGSPLAYVDQCYHAPSGTEGCNFFYNQSIRYQETLASFCPWQGFRCFNMTNNTVIFDTGYVDSKNLGLNSPQNFQLRRWAVCAPIVTNPPRPVRAGTNATHPDGMNDIRPNRPSVTIGR